MDPNFESLLSTLNPNSPTGATHSIWSFAFSISSLSCRCNRNPLFSEKVFFPCLSNFLIYTSYTVPKYLSNSLSSHSVQTKHLGVLTLMWSPNVDHSLLNSGIRCCRSSKISLRISVLWVYLRLYYLNFIDLRSAVHAFDSIPKYLIRGEIKERRRNYTEYIFVVEKFQFLNFLLLFCC